MDPKDKHIHLFLKEIIHSKKWEENIDAIITARNLVLNEYQLFPFIYNRIKQLENTKEGVMSVEKKMVSFKGQDAYFDNYPFSVALEKEFYKIKRKIGNKLMTTFEFGINKSL